LVLNDDIISTYLFKELLFHCDVVVSDAQHDQTVFWSLRNLPVLSFVVVLIRKFIDQFILD